MSRIKLYLMKIRRKPIGYLLFYLILTFIFFKITLNTIKSSKTESVINEEISVVDEDRFQSCPIPNYHDSNRYPKTGTLLIDLKCPSDDDLVSIVNGSIHISHKTYDHCSYKCVSWNSDMDYRLGDVVLFNQSQPVPCSYFVVFCDNRETTERKSQMIFSAIRLEKLIPKASNLIAINNNNDNNNNYNDVFIIGIDSMSYKALEYYLPKTFKIFHESLKGVSFIKFNTMGDGTTVNVQGLLTGTKDTETYEARRRIVGSKPVDNFNWIWRHYKEKGFVTLYAEEMTAYGTFQYRLNGFDVQPTDFYLRTPFMFAEKNGFFKNFCSFNRPIFEEYFRFHNDFETSYRNVSKFSFLFFSSLSHDDNKYVSYMDEDLAQFIYQLRKNNPQAFILLYSDHGHRFTSRLTMEGKYEERLPFFGISLPKEKDDLRSVVKENSDVLISGLDVHATLEDIIGIYKPHSRNRHMSLLRPLPKDRKCEDIESLPHWCSCLNWKLIINSDINENLKHIAKTVAKRISEFTSEDKDLCSELSLDKILIAYRLDANKEVLKFKQSADVDGFVPDLSDKIEQTTHWYRMTLRMTPGDAEFDLTISVHSNNSQMSIDKITPDDVSRINRYEPWIGCLKYRSYKTSALSDIRKFCICKNVVKRKL